MFGRFRFSATVLAFAVALVLSYSAVDHALALRVCSFRGTVIDNGWRSMTVRAGDQCAEVNVGWRTNYVPNRRPCIGQTVAVDFLLEDGYMKATKVVSLTPLPPSVQCYPPPPPRGTVCRTVGDDAPPVPSCAPSRPICSTKPPSHVSDRAWSPDKRASAEKPSSEKATEKKASPDKKKQAAPTARAQPEDKEKIHKEKPAATDDKRQDSVTGEVVASAPRSLSIRVSEEGEAAEVVNIRVGLQTKFIPFRRPAVGERVKVDLQKVNGDKFASTVQVIQ